MIQVQWEWLEGKGEIKGIEEREKGLTDHSCCMTSGSVYRVEILEERERGGRGWELNIDREMTTIVHSLYGRKEDTLNDGRLHL